jgi:carbamoyltransferase
MKLFGISTHHDSSYCFLDNGKILFHSEIERFTRIKHDPSPVRLYETIYKNAKQYLDACDAFVMPINVGEQGIVNEWHTINLNIFKDQYNLSKPLYNIGHHTCHAANAYYGQGIDNALIFTLDGNGWDIKNGTYQLINRSVFKAEGNKLKNLYFGDFGNPGQFWMMHLSRVFGMSTIFDEGGDESGTLMAMAAYGDPNKHAHYFDDIAYAVSRPKEWFEYSQIFSDPNHKVLNNTEMALNEKMYYEYDEKVKFLKQKLDTGEYNRFDLAASIQSQFEKYLLNFVMSYITYGDTKNICFSGGSALNCVALGKLAKILKKMGYNVYCDQAPSDSGLSLGAVKYQYFNEFNNPLVHYKKHSYLGSIYSSKTIRETLSTYNSLLVTENVDISNITNLLMSSKIISLFNEGSESGKRALGNRSIIADPRFAYTKDLINEKVKHRKSFRPFAPSVLREHVDEWFDFDIDSPYMSFAVAVKEDKQKFVPAILHKDNTARLQTVTQDDNGYYYDLISEFYKKTGVPMILNTSFNDREPIVETPKHAIDCFLKTQIDYLYFVKEKLLISKIS